MTHEIFDPATAESFLQACEDNARAAAKERMAATRNKPAVTSGPGPTLTEIREMQERLLPNQIYFQPKEDR